MTTQPNTQAEPTFGRIASQDALKAIKAENARVGLSVSESDEAVMAHQLASALRIDMDKGRTFLVDDAGNARSKPLDGAVVDLSVTDFIGMLQATATPTSRAKPSPAPMSAGANRTERAVSANAALRSTKSDAKAVMANDLVSRFGNPWVSVNKTHQAFVTNTNPTLAAQLRNAPGQ